MNPHDYTCPAYSTDGPCNCGFAERSERSAQDERAGTKTAEAPVRTQHEAILAAGFTVVGEPHEVLYRSPKGTVVSRGVAWNVVEEQMAEKMRVEFPAAWAGQQDRFLASCSAMRALVAAGEPPSRAAIAATRYADTLIAELAKEH